MSAWLLTLGASALAGVATCAESTLVDRVRRDYCSAYEDDPGGYIQQARQAALNALGERGRAALLDLARRKGPDRPCAFNYLATFGDARAMPLMREAAQDPSEDVFVRQAAIAGLGVLQDGASVDLLTSALFSGRSELSGVAALALGRIDDTRARAALRKAVEDGTAAPSLFKVLEALRRQRDREAVHVLKGLSRSDAIKSDSLRHDLVLTLAVIGGQDAWTTAVDLLSGFRDSWYRGKAVGAVLELLRQARDQAKDPAAVQQIDQWIAQAETQRF